MGNTKVKDIFGLPTLERLSPSFMSWLREPHYSL